MKYDVRDFVIGYMVEQFRKGHLYIPEYQREYIWKDHNRWGFIESVILGLPIPMIFLSEIEDDGRLEIVDGAQRIQTLEAFENNDITLKDLGILTKLNGFKFSDLPPGEQNKFRNKALRTIVLEDATTLETRKELFKRINTSGQKARPSEIRRGAFEGPFMDFVDKCARSKLFKKLCPISDSIRKRKEPQELVLRFFAYSEKYKDFRHDVEKFLNAFVRERRTTFPEKRLKSEFERMLNFVDKYFPNGFAKTRTSKITPRVRFEAISIGVNLALRENPDLTPARVEGWLGSDEFKVHTTSHATNSRTKLKGRVEYVRDQLLAGDE